MKARLRNITITLEERLARWARYRGSPQRTRACRGFLAEILKERMNAKERLRSG